MFQWQNESCLSHQTNLAFPTAEKSRAFAINRASLLAFQPRSQGLSSYRLDPGNKVVGFRAISGDQDLACCISPVKRLLLLNRASGFLLCLRFFLTAGAVLAEGSVYYYFFLVL